jgi:hypothetical protein
MRVRFALYARHQGSRASREPPRHIVYEARPQPQDHQVPGGEGQMRALQ